MSESIYQVLTPVGAFEAVYDDQESPVAYRGDDLAVNFFKNWLELNQISGNHGKRILPGDVEPNELWGFCQSAESGITVIPPFGDLLDYLRDENQQENDDMNTAILDAATGREALSLAKELKQIRNTIASMTGRAALSAAKRIREIRKALGVDKSTTDANGLDENGFWVMTKAEYENIHKDYRGELSDGTPAALKLINGATTLVPVKFSDEKTKSSMEDVIAVMSLLKQFIGKSQLASMGAGVRGEEGQYFKDKFVEVANVIKAMPHTYQTDGQGDKAIAHLHYFKGSMDWYITEKDIDTDGEGQIQAYGLADFGDGGEMGYISIKEIIASGVELDLHWSPKSIGAIRGKNDQVNDDQQYVDSGDIDRYSSMTPDAVQQLSDTEYQSGFDALEGVNEHTESVFFAAKRTGDTPLMARAEALVREQDAMPDGVTMDFTRRRFELMQEIKAMLNGDGQDKKTEFMSEISALRSETDITRFNEKLDDLAARIEEAGLMDELEPALSAVADVLTDLLAAAEKA